MQPVPSTLSPVVSGAGFSSPLLQAPFTPDRNRIQEQWARTNERLLLRWTQTWIQNAEAHTLAGRWKRKYQHALSIPITMLPMILTIFTSNAIVEENNVIVVIGLAVVAMLSSINTVMRFDATSAIHDNAAYRFRDLISDVEEVLSKEAQYRPDPDIFISNLKNRSDFINRTAPDVKVPTSDDDDDDDDTAESDSDGTTPNYNVIEQRRKPGYAFVS